MREGTARLLGHRLAIEVDGEIEVLPQVVETIDQNRLRIAAARAADVCRGGPTALE
jgi:hypothetical protein